MPVVRHEPGDDPLGPEHSSVLELLAEGLTVERAARRLFISRRTADRRLAEARIALGARTTTEAVARLIRLRAGRWALDLGLIWAHWVSEGDRGPVLLVLENMI
jgi:DNA-binding CsgD family transcriptional regulator